MSKAKGIRNWLYKKGRKVKEKVREQAVKRGVIEPGKRKVTEVTHKNVVTPRGKKLAKGAAIGGGLLATGGAAGAAIASMGKSQKKKGQRRKKKMSKRRRSRR